MLSILKYQLVKKDTKEFDGKTLYRINAIVIGNATVSGNARVYGNALVSGDAIVFGDA